MCFQLVEPNYKWIKMTVLLLIRGKRNIFPEVLQQVVDVFPVVRIPPRLGVVRKRGCVPRYIKRRARSN